MLRRLAYVLLFAALFGCQRQVREPRPVDVAATPAAPQHLSRAEALALVPDGANFILSANMEALAGSEVIGSELRRMRSVEAFQTLFECGLDYSELTTLVMGGDTNAEPGFVAIFSSPDIGPEVLDCLAAGDPTGVGVAVENGRRVLEDSASHKFYALPRGAVAVAAPGWQARFEARLDGGGQPATAGSMRTALEGVDLDSDVAIAMVPDEDLIDSVPGLRAFALEVNVANGVAVKAVNRFEESEMAQRFVDRIEGSGWKSVAAVVGVPTGIVESVRVDVEGATTTLVARASDADLRIVSDKVRGAFASDERPAVAASGAGPARAQDLDEVDARFVARLATDYRAKWSEGGDQEFYYDRCLGKAMPDVHERLREAFCLCMAEGMQPPDVDPEASSSACAVMLLPVVLRSSGTAECDMVHGREPCACLVETRADSSEAYLRAGEACLGAGD